MLLADSGCDVITPKFLEREKFNASNIRRLRIGNKEWNDYIPPAIASIIEKINVIKRLQAIASSDTKPTEYENEEATCVLTLAEMRCPKI